MPVAHHESHHCLLADAPAGRSRRVDAIAVPAGRAATNLVPAARLADDLDAMLLLMCWPGGADAAEFAILAAQHWPALRWRAMMVPEDLCHPLLPRSAQPDLRSGDWRHGPLSTKRNLALLLGRMAGWETLMFLDDDIRDVDLPLVRAAASRLGPAWAVGLTVDTYPDNSVVCHANRLSGAGQEVFVGAPALLVDLTAPLAYFPAVYNEDWIFLYDAVSERRVARVDGAEQVRYTPFADPGRARAEEFGDVVAEGLMAHLHDGDRSGPPVEVGYWREFLEARDRLISDVARRLSRRADRDARQALLALSAARQRLAEITPQRCVDFVVAWRADRAVWGAMIDDLDRLDDLDAAARSLAIPAGLVGATA
ncbi:MAG: hypothetical protein L0K86_05270 [Actinomycetia bacterium]|nr:hypothetical protein [Actinomycetes bacterium]